MQPQGSHSPAGMGSAPRGGSARRAHPFPSAASSGYLGYDDIHATTSWWCRGAGDGFDPGGCVRGERERTGDGSGHGRHRRLDADVHRRRAPAARASPTSSSSSRRTTPSTPTSATGAPRRRARTRPAPPARPAARPRPRWTPPGASPVVLDDTENAAYDPNHTQACELARDRRRARWTASSPARRCADPRQLRLRARRRGQALPDLAAQNAIADRYFQPIAGRVVVQRHVPRRREGGVHRQRLRAQATGSAVRAHHRPDEPTPGRRPSPISSRPRARRWPGTARATRRWWPRARAAPTRPPRCAFHRADLPLRLRSRRRPFLYYAQFASEHHVHARLHRSSPRTSRPGRCPTSPTSRASATTASTPATGHDHRRRRPSSPASSRPSTRAATRTTRSCW